MKKWFGLIIIFLGALLTDGIIMPALLDRPESFLTLLMLVALIVAFGIKRWLIWFGLIAAFIAEIAFGLYPGSLVIPWLLSAWLWYGITSFFSIKPFDECSYLSIFLHDVAGLILFAAFAVASAAVDKFFYGYSGFPVFAVAFRQASIWITALVGMSLFLVLFHWLGKDNSVSYF